MFERPDDLEDAALLAAVAGGWDVAFDVVVHAPLGFGSHHWVASGPSGRWFVTVDDLAAKVTGTDDSHDAAFDRLERSFRAAAVVAEHGLGFVVPPLPAVDGGVLRRLDDRYAVVLHRFVDGVAAGDGGSRFRRTEDLRAIVELVGDLHRATPAVADIAVRDDLTVPLRRELEEAIETCDRPWDAGPYGERARRLLAGHRADLERLLHAFDRLAAEVLASSERFVIAHGEPGAHNVMIEDGCPVLVDWETARLAAPERDLWDLAEGDPSVLARYQAHSGIEPRPRALAAYRCWYDLSEVAGYLALFRAPHRATDDAAESWKNLEHFLRPAERWPALMRAE